MRDIRILPMSMDDHEFEGKCIEGVQEDFFEKYLRDDPKSEYNYKNNGLISEEGDLILFQYNSHLIASADFISKRLYPEGWTNNPGYRGYYLFNNVRTFKPITNDEFNAILKEDPIKFTNAPHLIKQIRMDYDKLVEMMNIPRNEYKKQD